MVSHLTDGFNGVRKTCWGNMLTYFSFSFFLLLFLTLSFSLSLFHFLSFYFKASQMLILKLPIALAEGAHFVINLFTLLHGVQ